ncbi:MAG: hypothetical protein M3Y87_24525 [Myxococcota bacterium]|nr:hypothetical protein [Myxococcota bacterium]
MALDVLQERGTPLEKQKFEWRDLVRIPYSKLDDDAFTRVRVILMNGIESDAVRFKHIVARLNGELRLPLARIRRVEHFQQTMVNWLNPPDQNALETTIGFEQVAIEVTANVARNEPDPYMKSIYDFGLLEDFDHLYRYSALYDRLEGKDSNTLLQCYTDVMPGRPTSVEHRAPEDDLREPYDRKKAHVLTKIHAATIAAAEFQTHDYYMTVGPTFSDPIARQLYAEIAAIEEQHVTQYSSLADPNESVLEKWLVHELTEVWNYWSCYQAEGNARVKEIWERFLSYELGHLHLVMGLMEKIEKRDPMSIVPKSLPKPIKFESQRDYVREVLEETVHLRANGTQLVEPENESKASIAARKQLNSQGSPSEMVAAGWRWSPGGELTARAESGAYDAKTNGNGKKTRVSREEARR